MPFAFFALFVAAAIAFAVYGAYAARQRQKELAAWAAQAGLSFDPARDPGMELRYPGFGCFSRGDHRYAYNVLSGAWGPRPFLGFDYHYQTYSRDSKGRRRTHHHRFSAVILASDVALLPLTIRPEGFLDKVGEFFGFDDIDFESAEFSRRFHVSAGDRKWAFDVLHARAIEFLLASPVFTIVLDRGAVCAYRSSTFRVEEFRQAAEVAAGLLDRLPEYVLRERREAPPPLPA